jgi:hypothetical protein
MEWWNSFRHIGRPFVLSPGLLLVTVFDSHGFSDTRDYLDVIRTDGTVVTLGAAVPDSGRILEASNGLIFVARNAHLGPADTLLPVSLFTYHLREKFAITNSKKLSLGRN